MTSIYRSQGRQLSPKRQLIGELDEERRTQFVSLVSRSRRCGEVIGVYREELFGGADNGCSVHVHGLLDKVDWLWTLRLY